MSVIAKCLEQRSHLVPGKLKVTEFIFEVPKDYSSPSGGSIRLFARSAEKFEKPVDPPADKDEKKTKHLPLFAYFAGGPGFGCYPSYGGAYTPILDKGYKVVLLDQRGTGLSSTITPESLRALSTPEEQVAHLKLFRADNIVRDAEAVRRCLTADYPPEKQKWSILGQSFGGFCAVNYLCQFPEGLREVFLTGGLPPLVKQPDEVYRRLTRRAAERSKQYYAKFPEDVQRVQQLALYLASNDVKTFSGGRCTPTRLRALGILLGSHSGFETVHNMILRMVTDMESAEGCLSRATINEFDRKLSFDQAVLYALLHEPCYLQGAAANWSAQRMLDEHPGYKNFNLNGETKEPILFTTEMILPTLFDDGSIESLSLTRETAHLLAQVSDWPDLYSRERLAANEVPVYAAVYYDDLYVDFDFSQETAGAIKGCKTFITNTMQHDAISGKAEELVRELFAMRDDVRL